MSISGILIKISKEEISVSYVADSEGALPTSLPDITWPQPIEKFGGKAAAGPEYAIGKGLDEVLQKFSLPGSPDGNIFDTISKSALPVVVIAENDIPDEGISNIAENLATWGYDNVKVTRPDVVCIDYYNAHYKYDNLVVASSNGKDLSVSVFNRLTPDVIKRHNFEGKAVENRVEGLAELLWEMVKFDAYGLTMEEELPYLRREAEKLLKENPGEKSGDILLSDGERYQYFILRSQINGVQGEGESIEDIFTSYLQKNGVADRSNTAIIIRNQAIGSNYLKNTLTGSFKTEANEDEELAKILDKYVATREWEKISVLPDKSLVKPVGPDPGPDPGPDDDKKRPVDLVPVKLDFRLEAVKVKTGWFKTETRQKLTIIIEPPMGLPLPCDSVLCIQETPLDVVSEKNVMKEFEKGRKGPFSLEFELPLKNCPNAKSLRVYFKPSPYEKVGLNNAYRQNKLVINLKANK